MPAGRHPRHRGSARARPPVVDGSDGWSPPGLAAVVCRLILLRLLMEFGRAVSNFFLFRSLDALV